MTPKTPEIPLEKRKISLSVTYNIYRNALEEESGKS